MEIREHFRALADQLSSARITELSEQRTEFRRRWFEQADAGSYMATSHSLWTGSRLTHPGAWYRDGEALGMERRYYDLPLQDVRLCPEPLLIAREDYRPWQVRHVPKSWRYMVLDIDKSDLDAGGETAAQLLKRLKRWRFPAPWCVVNSGSGGLHIWWKFERAYYAGSNRLTRYTEETVREFKTQLRFVQTQLAALFHGDRAQLGMRQSYRHPGTVNPKWAKPDGTLRLCQVRHASWRTCRLEDFDHIPVVVDWRPELPPVHDGLPEWSGALLRELGVRKARTKPDIIELSQCPSCHERGTAFLSAITGRIKCHRSGCELHRSRTLDAIAEDVGFTPPATELPTDRPPRTTQAAQHLAAPVHHTRTDEQAVIQAATDAWLQRVETTGKSLAVIQSSVGAGKDTVILPSLADAWQEGNRAFSIYTHRFSDAQRKIHELTQVHRRSLPVIGHCSPISLEIDGQRCTHPERLRRFYPYGYPASLGCSACPAASTCQVQSAVWRLDQPDSTVTPLEIALHPRLLHTSAALDKPGAWVDERFPLVLETETTVHQLERFQTACVRSRRPRRGLDGEDHRDFSEWSDVLEEIIDALKLFPATSENRRGRRVELCFWPNWRGMLEHVEIPGSIPVPWPDGAEQMSWPSWISEAALSTLTQPDSAQEAGSCTLVRGGRIVTIHAALDHLPNHTLWSNATAWAYRDLIDNWAQRRGIDVTYHGNQLEYAAHYRHYPSRYANRSGLLGSPQTGLTREGRRQLKAAVMNLRREHQETRPNPMRMLIVTYKIAAEWLHQSGFLEGLFPDCSFMYTHYERAIGTNEWSGKVDELLLFGDPNPNTVSIDPATAILYGNTSETMMKRLSEELIAQACGRPRPRVLAEVGPDEQIDYVGITAISTFRPATFPADRTIDLSDEWREVYELRADEKRQIVERFVMSVGVMPCGTKFPLVRVLRKVSRLQYTTFDDVETLVYSSGAELWQLGSPGTSGQQRKLVNTVLIRVRDDPFDQPSPSDMSDIVDIIGHVALCILTTLYDMRAHGRWNSETGWAREVQALDTEGWLRHDDTTLVLHPGAPEVYARALRWVERILGARTMGLTQRASFWLDVESVGWSDAHRRHYKH